jgi:5-bromo-4-chloroindolyl phosphate hydrolysis protein
MKAKYLIAAGGAALAGAGAMMGLHLPFLIEGVIALAAAGGVGAGLTLVQSGPSTPKPTMIENADAAVKLLGLQSGKLTKEQLEAIALGATKIAAIRSAIPGVRAPNTARQIRKICDIGDKILQDFREDPSDITHARTWLDVYLDQTLEMVEKYARLSRNGTRSAEAQRVLGEVEKTLDVIEKQSEELLQKLLHNDILGLDVDQQVVRQILNSEKM